MSEASLSLPVATAAAIGEPGALTGLDQWPLNRPAELMTLAPATSDDQARTLHRLAEVGFLPGETLRVLSRGWLRGGPMAVRVGQSTFALRAHEASLLRVRALHPAD